MAATELNCLRKRDLLNRADANRDELMKWGAHFEQAGNVTDAVDFYQKAEAGSELERLLDGARDEGDVFMFRKLNHLLGRKASVDDWKKVARRAEELGKLAFAEQAKAQTGEKDAEAAAES